MRFGPFAMLTFGSHRRASLAVAIVATLATLGFAMAGPTTAHAQGARWVWVPGYGWLDSLRTHPDGADIEKAPEERAMDRLNRREGESGPARRIPAAVVFLGIAAPKEHNALAQALYGALAPMIQAQAPKLAPVLVLGPSRIDIDVGDQSPISRCGGLAQLPCLRVAAIVRGGNRYLAAQLTPRDGGGLNMRWILAHVDQAKPQLEGEFLIEEDTSADNLARAQSKTCAFLQPVGCDPSRFIDDGGQPIAGAAPAPIMARPATVSGGLTPSGEALMSDMPDDLGEDEGTTMADAQAEAGPRKAVPSADDIDLSAYEKKGVDTARSKAVLWSGVGLWVAGAAAIGAGTYTFFAAQDAHDRYEKTQVQSEARKARQETEDMLLATKVLWGAGGGLFLIGMTMVIYDLTRDPAASSPTRTFGAETSLRASLTPPSDGLRLGHIGPAAFPNGLGLTLAGGF